MKITRNIILCLAFIIAGCAPLMNPDIDKYGMKHITFTESELDFPNPERGFTTNQAVYSASDSPYTLKGMEVHRKVNRTLIVAIYYLTDYMESDISAEYLNLIQENFRILRQGGMKCVLRFAYKDDMTDAGHPWDASPYWVHRHIEQLKPIMQQNSDVILCLQAGFVGVWGEWAITDNFVQAPNTVEDHALRKEVMLALLDAMPEDRQVALRTPMFKRKMFLSSYSDTLTFDTAHNGSHVARICGHNDCFGADAADMGTFLERGSRDLWKKDTRFVFMGGETCQVYNYCHCEGSMKDLEDYHWTYLNYGGKGVGQWRKEGCWEEIARRLGYRLSLTELSYTAKAKAGKDFDIVLKLKNTGFASPINPRDVELILEDEDGQKKVYKCNGEDPRFWFAGETVTIRRSVVIPESFKGECSLYLNLPDGRTSLRTNPRYSIRLANDDVWDEKTGYNRIAQILIK